jgi:hypothetical protein
MAPHGGKGGILHLSYLRNVSFQLFFLFLPLYEHIYHKLHPAGPVVQKPVNANLGLNLLKLGLNCNPRLLCVVQSQVSLNPRLKQGLNLTRVKKKGYVEGVKKTLGETNSVQRFYGGKSTSKSKF